MIVQEVLLFLLFIVIIAITVCSVVNRICTCRERKAMMQSFGDYIQDRTLKDAEESLKNISNEIFRNSNMKK